MRVRSMIVPFVALTAGLTPIAHAVMSSTGCLCTSDQPCWPSADTFAQLASQVTQPLVYPLPTASRCYPPSDPSGNCTDINVNWGDGNWRAEHPGSMELPNWETLMFQNGTFDACFLDTNVTGVCDQGRVPVIGVDARGVADVQAALAFAVEHELKLVVKNTGHDFIGRSAARGSFMVWTHNMKNITYDAAFVPQGAPETETYEAVTLGAGVQWHEAYAAVNKYGRMMVGGIAVGGSVGAAGGWLSGGGHSFLSPSYGLGVDNALEISIVLSTGEYLVTNEYQNSNLFWAVRGGGGSTYGVVISVTYRTYPKVPIQAYQYVGNVTNSSVMQEFVGGFLQFQAQFTDDGWGGYGGISNEQVSFTYFAPNMTNETVAATTQGWENYTESLAPYGVVSSSVTAYEADVYNLIYEMEFSGGTEVGAYVLVSSRLLSRDSIAANYSGIAQALIDTTSGFNTIAGGKVNQIPADSAGLNPAWRNAVLEATYGIVWNETTTSMEMRDMIQQLQGWIQEVYDVTPLDGVYVNEATQFEIDWQYAFFGEHYSMLKSIKDKYDPYRLFVVTKGVGSDDWNENLTCRYGL